MSLSLGDEPQYQLEMATGRAGPENPGPRTLRAETNLNIFYLRVLCATENSNVLLMFYKFY